MAAHPENTYLAGMGRSQESPASKPVVRRCRVLGVCVDTVTISYLNECIATAIERGERCIIGCHNLHSIHLFHADACMREFYDLADYIHIDGMVLVGLARLMGYRATRNHRVTWLDWLEPLMALAAASGWRVFYLGSAGGVAERAAEVLRHRHPGLVLQIRHGYFDCRLDSLENRATVDAINEFRPHLLMVGMGQPRQERWVRQNVSRVTANAIVTPGACFDYVAGVLPVPWRFLGRIGLEWAFRLVTEPRRLGRRYLVEPWSLAGLLWRDLARRFLSRKVEGI